MCAQCLQTRYDIGEGISKQVQQNTCRGCGRYERRDGSFAPVEPESAELMALLLKKPRGLGSVRLVDASFIWTEPHSRRIKIKACVQKEVVSGAVLQQSLTLSLSPSLSLSLNLSLSLSLSLSLTLTLTLTLTR